MNLPLKISIIVAIAIILLFIFMTWSNLSALLKDQSTQPGDKKPFSLSRTLICLWTLLIIIGFCYIALVTGDLPVAQGSTLALLGIASGTALVGRSIERTQATTVPALNLIQNDASEGFFLDILSDANGVSISRLQTLCFNLIYAGLFINTLITKHQLGDFDATTLGLLGISSGAYAALKIPEVK